MNTAELVTSDSRVGYEFLPKTRRKLPIAAEFGRARYELAEHNTSALTSYSRVTKFSPE